jgi:probable HAF family extracellular repeat protein
MLKASRSFGALSLAAMALVPRPASGVDTAALPGLAAGSAKAYSINTIGTVVGSATSAAGVEHAVVWHGRRITDLTPGATTTSVALDVNDSGQIVGRGGPFGANAVLWQNGRTIVLPRPPDQNSYFVFQCTATSINYLGFIGGFCFLDVNSSVIGLPVVWRHRVPQPVWDAGQVLAVNDLGHLAGRHELTYDGDAFRAALKDASGYHELPPFSAGDQEQANAINNSDVVVGQAEGRPVLWRDGKVRALAASGAAYGVNRWGAIVGTAGASSRPTAWRQGRVTTLASRSGAARAINDLGHAVGWVTQADGSTVAVRWTIRG